MQQVQYAHWHQFFENLPVAPQTFYAHLQGEILRTQLPSVTSRPIEFPEGGMLSSRRLYLEIQRDWLSYHICVAPFGTGFFVSSRLLVWQYGFLYILIAGIIIVPVALSILALLGVTILPACLLLIAILVILYNIWKGSRNLTYYRIDTMLAFHEAIHRLLIATINRTIEPLGRKPLSETESKPTFDKLLQR